MALIGLPDYAITKSGQVYSTKTSTWLTHQLDRNGYPVISLYLPDGRLVPKKIHRLLAIMFIPNPSNKPYVNHIDGIKMNFDLTNLEWVTHHENTKHAMQNGLYPQRVLTEELAHQICAALAAGIHERIVAKSLNVTFGSVSSIKLRKSWEYVSCQYKVPLIQHPDKPLSNQHITIATWLLCEGFTCKDIALLLQVSESRINMLRHYIVYSQYPGSVL